MNINKTLDLIPIDVIEKILFNNMIFYDFLNKRNGFETVDFTSYLTAINDYYNYFLIKKENVINHIGPKVEYLNKRFNFRYKNKVYAFRNDILYNEFMFILEHDEAYKDFILCFNNEEIFNKKRKDLENAIIEYYDYVKDNNLLLSEDIAKKINYIIATKKAHDGQICKNNLDPEFARKIISQINIQTNKLSISRQIYLKLCEVLEYDENYFLQNNKSQFVEDSLNLFSNEKIICGNFSTIYSTFLKLFDIKSVICSEGLHKYVSFVVDDNLVVADGTSLVTKDDENYKLNDISRVKIGVDTAGFNVIYGDGNIKDIDQENEKNSIYLNEYISSISNKFKSLHENKDILSFNDKMQIFFDIYNNSKLKNIELICFMNSIRKKFFNGISETVNYVNINNEGENELCVLITNGISDSNIDYYLISKKRGITKTNWEYLNALKNSNKLVKISKNNIPGLENIKNGYNR